MTSFASGQEEANLLYPFHQHFYSFTRHPRPFTAGKNERRVAQLEDKGTERPETLLIRWSDTKYATAARFIVDNEIIHGRERE
jgi:hypothetical protein